MFKKLFCKHEYEHYSFKREWAYHSYSAGFIYLEKFVCEKCGKKKEDGLSGVRKALAKRILDEKEARDENKFKLNVDKEYDKYRKFASLGERE